MAGLSLGVLAEEGDESPSPVGILLLVTWAFTPVFPLQFLGLLEGLFLPAMRDEVC